MAKLTENQLHKMGLNRHSASLVTWNCHEDFVVGLWLHHPERWGVYLVGSNNSCILLWAFWLGKKQTKKQAGAELCQAHWKLGLAKLDLPSMYFSYI